MIIWKNCFLNLTIVLWQKLVCFFKYRKSDWPKFRKVHFRFWTIEEKWKFFEELDEVMDKWEPNLLLKDSK